MLNRTNRTLSANLNRLNLGTRSLATLANANNNGSKTLRTALVYPFVDVRAGVADHPEFVEFEAHFITMMMGLKPEKPAMSPKSGSSRELRQLTPSCQLAGQQGQPIALAIPPAIPARDIPVAGRTQRGDAKRPATSRRHARTAVLGWRPERSRLAERAAHVVQVSVAAP